MFCFPEKVYQQNKKRRLMFINYSITGKNCNLGYYIK